jgi:hypothetical protein
MTTWEREEWAAARRADYARPHPDGCLCLDRARDEIGEDE